MESFRMKLKELHVMLQQNEVKFLAYEAKLDQLRAKVDGCDELKTEVTLLDEAIAYGKPSSREAPKMKIFEPKSFSGVRGVKEVELHWNVQRYLRALKIEDKAKKVNIVSLYYTKDVML